MIGIYLVWLVMIGAVFESNKFMWDNNVTGTPLQLGCHYRVDLWGHAIGVRIDRSVVLCWQGMNEPIPTGGARP